MANFKILLEKKYKVFQTYYFCVLKDINIAILLQVFRSSKLENFKMKTSGNA